MSLYCVNWESVAKTDGIVRHPYLEYKENVTKISNFLKFSPFCLSECTFLTAARQSLCAFFSKRPVFGAVLRRVAKRKAQCYNEGDFAPPIQTGGFSCPS